MTKQKKSKIFKPGQVWTSPNMFRDRYNKKSKPKKKPTKGDINKILNKRNIKRSFEEPEIDSTEDMSDIVNKVYKETIQKLRESLHSGRQKNWKQRRKSKKRESSKPFLYESNV